MMRVSTFIGAVVFLLLSETEGGDPYITGTFTVSIDEEQAIGTLVPFDYTVNDDDLPGDTLYYALKGPDAAYFDLDGSNWITIANVLDYDAGQINFRITLEVMDSANHKVSQDFTVTLKDINDNTPICSPNIIYTGAITENDPAHTIAASVSCSDADGTPANNVITLSLFNAPAEFELSGNNVETTSTGTDYENKMSYRLVIHAVDNGTPPKTGTAEVHIQIQPLNEHTPKWGTFIPARRSHTIDEDSPPGTSIVRVVASDMDDGSDGVIIYSLVSTVTDELKSEAGVFGINAISGQLSTIRYVDRDDGIASYKVRVRASDGGKPPKTKDTLLTINLQPINDNAPIFTSTSYSKTLLETVTKNEASIITVTATDKDLPTSGTTITYSIELGNVGSRFEFDSQQPGLLKLKQNKAIDLDNGVDPSVYTLRIIATDGGSPEKTGTSHVTITVTAVNESPPVIGTLTPSSPISVDEDIGIGKVIVTVPAENGDARSGETITFSITQGNTNADFVIDPTTGIIRNQHELDYEWTSTYTLIVVVTDSGVPSQTDSTTIVINVADVNEAPPTCPSYYMSVSVEESSAVGDVVTTLACRDADSADVLTFTITDGDTSVFSMDSTTRQLTLKSALDYEKVTDYQLTIKVSDSAKIPRTATAKVTVLVSPVNEHSPTLTQALYTVSIAENDAVGTSVQQITASDKDVGLLHGTLRYSITAGNSLGHFSTDTNGLVSTAHSLDREKTPSYSLIISVADDVVGAYNALTSTTTVSVMVTDCNDNPPVFNPVLYIKSHMETAQPATPLVTVTSTDDDSATNNNPLYTIFSGDVDNIFEMSGTNLQLQSQKSMDYTTRQVHDLVIHVTDQGTPALTAQARIIIKVLSVNSNPPVFSGSSSTLPALSETTAIGTSIYQAVATDSDGGTNGEIYYSIDSGNNPVDSFGIDSRTGTIFVWSLLDYDTAPTDYNLTIKAEDGGGKEDTMWICIPLKNENDNVPNFGATMFNLNVDENVSSGTTIDPPLVASDGDSGSSGQVSYSIVAGDGTTTFSIDSTSAVISTKDTIDYERKTLYTLVVKAVDAGSPVNSATCLVLISVNDLNDNAPLFSPVYVTIAISESTVIGTSVITVVANDDDSSADQNNAITYSLTNAFFSVNPSTGEITTTAQIDRESKESHPLTIEAYDRTAGVTGSLTGTTTVTVNLIDVNDNSPVIASTSCDLSIPEGLSSGYVVVTISASDEDAGDNARLDYTITNGATHNDLIIERDSGIIQVENVLDRETTDKYFLEIAVTDNGSPSLTASMTCSVTIQDVNDNVPTFSQSSYNFNVAERLPVNSRVGVLTASDEDLANNGQFTFQFVNFWVGNSSHFKVNPSLGDITTNSILDRELLNVYKIRCRVFDSGIPRLSSEVNITIHVTDENDNNPLFTSIKHTGAVVENSSVGTKILSLTISDLDVGANADITLSIDASSTAGANANIYLGVSSATREITVKATIDREVDSSFVFQIIAVDGGTSPRTSSFSVSIDVTDVNDNAPIFNPVFYNTEIAYTGECDNSITALTATDKDVGMNAQVEYYLIDSKDRSLFTIDSAGVFSLKSTAAANSVYVIEAGVRDKGNPVNYASSHATIRIDTFDPTNVVISFLLSISKTDFQTKKGLFLKQVQDIIRVKFPSAIVRLWCIEKRSETAIQPTNRRRLLESSTQATVHVLTLADDTTESAANIKKEKTIIAATQILPFFTSDSKGSPSDAITGPAWSYFGVETVRIYYRKTTQWADTPEGIAIIFFIVVFIALLIAVMVFVSCWIYKKRRTRAPSPVTHTLIDYDTNRRSLDSTEEKDADKENSQSSEEATPVNGDGTPIKENATLVKENATPVKENATPVKENATPVKENATPVNENATPVKEHTTVKNDSHPVKKDTTPVKKDVTPVNKKATHVKEDATPVKKDATPSKKDATPVKKDATHVKDVASLVKEDASPVKKNATLVKDHANVKKDATHVKDVETLVKKDSTPVKNDAKPVKNDATTVKQDITPIKESSNPPTLILPGFRPWRKIRNLPPVETTTGSSME